MPIRGPGQHLGRGSSAGWARGLERRRDRGGLRSARARRRAPRSACRAPSRARRAPRARGARASGRCPRSAPGPGSGPRRRCPRARRRRSAGCGSRRRGRRRRAPGGPKRTSLRAVGPPKAWQAGSVGVVGLGLDDDAGASAPTASVQPISSRRDLVDRAIEEVSIERGARGWPPSRSRREGGEAAAGLLELLGETRRGGAAGRDLGLERLPPSRSAARSRSRAASGTPSISRVVELGERLAGVERGPHEPADEPVGLAERHPLRTRASARSVAASISSLRGRGEPLAVEA